MYKLRLGDYMSFRTITTDNFTKRMASCNSAIAMDNSSSKGFSKWVNKDIRNAAASGDWSELLEKAQKYTKRFRNEFYRKGY